MTASRSSTGRPSTGPGIQSGPAATAATFLGGFLGLALLKFGNPVVLDHRVESPANLAELWSHPWPVRWGYWIGFLVLGWAFWALNGRGENSKMAKTRWGMDRKWLVAAPILWLAWQGVAAFDTIDGELTPVTLIHFGTCVLAFFSGRLLRGRHGWQLGCAAALAAAFSIVLVRASNQHLFEFRQEYAAMKEGATNGWKGFPEPLLLQMEHDGLLVRTNGLLAPSEMILTKLQRGRVYGTLVYPNALAGVILLLGPVALWLALGFAKNMKPTVGWSALGLVVFLVGGCLLWTGSRSGWLLAFVQAGVALMFSPWSIQRKLSCIAAVLLAGGIGFFLRNRDYLEKGATSISARGDYWRAAWDTFRENPVTGSGPGSFYRSYSARKRPESEMARLAHNDFLQQASDSGVPGVVLYLGWVGAALFLAARRSGILVSPLAGGADRLAARGFEADRWVWLGLAGWFAQGLSEFGLYIPAPAWTAFALLGALTLSDDPAAE